MSTPSKTAGSKASAQPAVHPSRPIVRYRSPGLDLTEVVQGGIHELHLTLRPLPGEKPAIMAERLAALLAEHDAVVVRQEVFGSCAAQQKFLEALQLAAGSVDWPVTAAQGLGCGSDPLAGTHVLAISGTPVQTITHEGEPIGRVFQDAWARHVLLGNLQPDDSSRSKPDQAGQAYQKMAAMLAKAGMNMRQVARTWLFLDDILSWYGPLNAVRTRFYQEQGVFDGLVPASTGVGARNARSSALVAGAWAVEGLNGAFSVSEVASPKQCPAPRYGSSFSRAVVLGSPGLRRLMVSGTASIEPGGASVCRDDVEGQIDLTMQVVRAILVACDMDFAETSRATAYFKNPADVRCFDRWRAASGLQSWPVICAQDDICRDELLFEIELDALRIPDRS
jgi:enamine deaminase RidA (YjgF/YER057c/UK114 family)